MPDVIGELIVTAIVATGEGEGIAAFAEGSFLGISGLTAIGSTAAIAGAIGLKFALDNPTIPKPEDGAQPLKQAIPSRVRGYWINRLSGYYMLFLAAGGDSQDMLAFHSGPIEEILQVYLHDIAVSTVPDAAHGVVLEVQSTGSGYFAPSGAVHIQIFYGLDSQTTYGGILTTTSTSGVWTTDFMGKGIACMALLCNQAPDPTTFTQVYPQGLPLPSVVAKCTPVFDPRDVTQSYSDRSTWKASPNGVLQLINYLTETDGGMGEDIDEILPPDVLAQWMIEATICDNNVGWQRYTSAGWYQFDNSPENVVNKILATFDGWLGESGDGTLALTVGFYREPTDPPITVDHILGVSVNYGIADEAIINQLDVSYNNPLLGYVSDQIDPIRDEDSISLTGIVRSKPLDLSWVQNPDQATILGRRAMTRLNPKRSGTLTTKLYGMRYLGKRWVKVQFPSWCGADLADVVVEIQDRAQIDIMNGRVTFNWNLVDTAALLAAQ